MFESVEVTVLSVAALFAASTAVFSSCSKKRTAHVPAVKSDLKATSPGLRTAQENTLVTATTTTTGTAAPDLKTARSECGDPESTATGKLNEDQLNMLEAELRAAREAEDRRKKKGGEKSNEKSEERSKEDKSKEEKKSDDKKSDDEKKKESDESKKKGEKEQKEAPKEKKEKKEDKSDEKVKKEKDKKAEKPKAAESKQAVKCNEVTKVVPPVTTIADVKGRGAAAQNVTMMASPAETKVSQYIGPAAGGGQVSCFVKAVPQATKKK